MLKATRQQIRQHNRNLVLKNLFEHESISRAEIARITSLTRTTVSEIVDELLTEGLVSEVGVGSSLGGKSPILLSLQADARWLISLDLAHNQFTGAIVNLRGHIVRMVALPVNDRNGDEALALVYDILDELIGEAGRPLLGIGVGTPGLVNARQGMVVDAVNLDWKNLPLARLLEQRYHLPVSVLNDSQAAALGEFTYGHQTSSENHLVVINVRHGIGAGIIIGGTLFQGEGGSAGEIGHVVVVPENGLPCRCGNRGCLETVASAQALIRQARQRVSQGQPTQIPQTLSEINLDTIEQAFQAGDPLAGELVLETARYLGMTISNLVGVLNIQKIVLTGDMTRFGEPWVRAIKESMPHLALPGQAQSTHIDIGRLGSNGILLGAAAALINNYSLLFKRQPTAEY